MRNHSKIGPFACALLILLPLPACTSGVVAPSRDAATIYERADNRLTNDQKVLSEIVIPALTSTGVQSRKIQIDWDCSVEKGTLQEEFVASVALARSERERQKLRRAGMLRLVSLDTECSAKENEASSEVGAEMQQLIASHQALVSLSRKLLENDQAIQRCLDFSFADTVREALRFNFSPAKSQCFLDVNRTKDFLKESKDLIGELKKLRERGSAKR